MADNYDFSDFDDEKEDYDFSDFDESEEITIEAGEGSMPSDFSPEEAEKMSALQAFGTGVSEGATLGLDRPLGGAVAAGLASTEDKAPYEDIAAGISDLISGGTEGREDIKQNLEYQQRAKDLGITETKPTKDLLEEYYKGKAGVKQLSEQAMEDQPAANLAGNIAGGLVSGPAIGGAKSIASAQKIKKLKTVADRAKLLGKLQTSKKLGKAALGEAFKTTSREGAKAGALAGLNFGDARLLEGEVGETLEQTAQGAGLGVAIGGGLTVAGTAMSGIIKKIPGISDAVESFKLGFGGKSIETPEVRDEITKTSRKYIRDFNARLKTLGLKKQEMDEIIEGLGITINTKDDINEARKIINSIDSKSIRKKADGLMDVLEDYMGESKEYKKAADKLRKDMAKKSLREPIAEARAKQEAKSMKRTIEKLQKPTETKESLLGSKDLELDMADREALVRQDTIQVPQEFGPPKAANVRQATDVTPFKPSPIEETEALGLKVQKYKDLSSGKVQAELTSPESLSRINPEELSIDQAKDLLDELNQQFTALGNSGEAIPQKVERSATALAKKLRAKVNAAYKEAGDATGTDISDINKKFNRYLEAKDISTGGKRSITGLDKDRELQQMAKFIEGQSDTDVVQNLDLFLKRVKQADPEMFNTYGKEIAELRRMADLASGSEAIQSGSKVGAIFGGLSGFANRVSNFIGRVASGPSRTVKSLSTGSKNVMAKVGSKFVQSSPEAVQGYIQKASTARNGSRFINQLQKAADSNDAKRRAILFGLYTNPSFREAMLNDEAE